MAKKIIVTNIDWDTDGVEVDLPKTVEIPITEDIEYLLDDMDGYADEIADYLSDEYEFCINAFVAEVEED